VRLLIVAALALAILAVICAAVPTTILGMGVSGWIAASLVAYFLDLLAGSSTTFVARRPPQ
jgi:hypothetical protein